MVLANAEHGSFGDLMAVRRVDSVTFESLSRPFQPVRGFSAAFGGHVLAQSIVCGSYTVPSSSYVCIGSHSYFLHPVDSDIPLVYEVTELRTSRKYGHRLVNVSQNGDAVYVALIAYKCADNDNETYEFQAPFPDRLLRPYSGNAADMPKSDLESLAPASDSDSPMYERIIEKLNIRRHFHPLDCRKIDTSGYNQARPDVTQRRIAHVFQSRVPLNDPNLVVAALAYMSDRNSLFTVTNIQDNPDVNITKMASLNHAFVVHTLPPPTISSQWLAMVSWTDRATDGRALYEGRIWAGNVHVASFLQDGIVKVAHDSPRL